MATRATPSARGASAVLLASLFLVPTLTAAESKRPARAITFPVPETRLWLGGSQVIAFRSKPADHADQLAISITPADAVEILQQPAILAGESVGYLRVRGLKECRATLRVGSSKLALDIVPDPARAAAAPGPAIVSPMAGTALWGKVAFGVELPEGSPAKTRVVLTLPGGRELDPVSSVASGSTRQFTFEVDADSLQPGRAEFQAVGIGDDDARSPGKPLAALVAKPEVMLSGACAEMVDSPRPERFGEERPLVAKDPGVPGGAYIVNNRSDPAWCLPVETREDGWYQMMITARGSFAGGCYPSVGMILGENSRPAQSVRIADSTWRRYPIGAPIHMTPGRQTLTVRFMNDFAAAKKNDRNFALSRFEWARVPMPAAAPDSHSSSMMTASDGEEPAMMMQPAGSAAAPPRVAFAKVFDESPIMCPISLEATSWWQGKPAGAAPRVDLLVNGHPVQTQYGDKLAFHVPVEAFSTGENTVQLRATQNGGASALSSEQRLILNPTVAAAKTPARFLRYTVLDPAWDPSLAQRLGQTTDGSATFFANGESFLTLPDDLAGAFRVTLEARGQDFKGPPIFEVFVRKPGEDSKNPERIPVRNAWQSVQGPLVQLERGPKQLVLRFVNDKMEWGNEAKNLPGGDRNLWLKAVRLEENTEPPREKPTLAIRYPLNGQTVGDADAVIADIFSRTAIATLDLVIDNQPQHLDLHPDTGLGPALFPLITRLLGEGTHKLRVVATDTAKNRSESPELTITVRRSTATAARSPYERALFLLNRFGFGPEPSELIAILTLGEKEWLHRRLDSNANDPAELATADDFRTAFPADNDAGQTVRRALRQLLVTPNPVRARFTLWAENHFSTWINKVGGVYKWREHERFAALGPAPFLDLLEASATSPAMLVYLDQKNSFADHLNENYAREIMELHTLGVHGGYTQKDVTTLAHLLNGWTLSEEADLAGDDELTRNFRFSPELNDGAARQILGMEFPAVVDGTARYDSVLKALEMLAAHPSTADFISEKLAEHYVSDPPPPKLVHDLSQVFLRTGGDMRAMLEAIAEHPDFWKADSKISTPIDFSLRYGRLAGSHDAGGIADFLNRSGMGLFDRTTPDGWPEADDNYANSNALLQRWRFAQDKNGSLRPLVSPAWVPPAKTPLANANAQRLVDLVAVRLTGQPLSPASNDAAVKYLITASKTDPDRVRLVTAFVAQLPELSLR